MKYKIKNQIYLIIILVIKVNIYIDFAGTLEHAVGRQKNQGGSRFAEVTESLWERFIPASL